MTSVEKPAHLRELEAAGLDPETLRALYVAYLKSYAAKAEKLTRPVMSVRFPKAGKTPYRAPSGESLGYIQREDPPPAWKITDTAALDDHLRKDLENVTTTEELDADPEELLALVREHRPEWFQTVTHVKPEARTAALAAVKKAKKGVPGITLERSDGDLVIRADGDHERLGEVYGQLIRDGLMNPDGTVPEVEPVQRRPSVETRLPELGTRVTTRMKDQADDAFDRGDDGWWQDEADPFAGVPTDPFAGIPQQ